METLFDDISAEFVRILNDEAQKPDGRRKSSSPESIKVDEETQDGLINAFATTYQKEMSLSNNLSDISSEICKETVLSYTITDQDKQAILNICDLIIKALQRVKVQTDRIDNKQRELKNISNTEAMLPWKASVEYDLNYLAKSLDEEYSQLERLCSDAIIRLEPKMHIHGSLAKAYAIVTELLDNRDRFEITCPDTFSYTALSVNISEFTKHVKLLFAYFKDQ